MKPWNEVIDNEQIAYVWMNQYVYLGVGTTSPNGRVNPKITKQSLMSKKDAGKTLIAAYVSKLTGERVELRGTPDESEHVSRNTTQLELDLKESLTRGTFMVYKGTPYSKVEFMDKVFVPHVNDVFGEDSVESMIAKLAAGDGDLWGRFGRHPTSRKALENIIEELLWVDQ